jgi:serine O-acetyltransferase
MRRLRAAAEQLGFLAQDLRKINRSGKWWRWYGVWFGDGFNIVATYRLNRCAYLALGPVWPAAMQATRPLAFLLRPWASPCEIDYRADLGGGLRVLHPTLGAVVSAYTVAGRNLVLVGGNCIGARPGTSYGDLTLGDDVTLGANAVVLGPVRVGARANIGAGAVVVDDVPDDATAIGVPATARVRKRNGAGAVRPVRPEADDPES